MAGRDWKHDVPLPAAVRLTWHDTEPFPRDVPLDAFYRGIRFPEPDGPLPYVVANMVMTQNAEATLLGKAFTIGTAVDALAMTRLRTAVDAVLSGSGTLVHDDVTAVLPPDAARIRAANGKPPRLLAAVVASSVAFGADTLARAYFAASGFDKLILTAPGAAPAALDAVARRGVEVAAVATGPDGRPSVRAVLEALSHRGVRAVVCEGGPRFLASLLAAHLVREYFLTTAPILTGRPDAPRPVAGAVASEDAPLLLARISRYEHTFRDPGSGAVLVETFDRFRLVYPQA
jgi:riboflavin biosynthesis pyrimidine reductase